MTTVLGNVIVEEALTVNGKDVEEIANTGSLNSNTGIITGGVLSVASSTEFNISAGEGVIISLAGNIATETKVTWGAFNNITPANLLTDIITHIFINSTGNIVELPTNSLSLEQYRTLIYIGKIIHVNSSTITTVINRQISVYQSMHNTTDFIKTVGIINEAGNNFSPNGNNLSLNKTVGNLFSLGVGNLITPNSPNIKIVAAAAPLSFSYRLQDGVTLSATTTINPAIYDLNGVQTAVPNNKYTIQRIYVLISGLTFIQFGQQLYDTITQAKLGIDSEPFVTEINNATDACLRAVLIVKEDATDLTDSSKAVIFNANKFGDFNIGKSVTDLQGSYNNSQDGVVSTSTTNNAVKFKRGTAADSDNVLEILDGSGATSFYVKGDGSSSINALLDGKANTSHTHVAADITDLSKTSVGLSNVQNVDQTNASNISSGTLSNARLTANLSQIGGLTLATNDFLQYNGTTVTNITPSQVKTSIGLNNLVNSLQVINAGNGTSFASGAVSARPVASVNGRFYAATDSGPYLDNGSSWLPLQVAITGDISISANGTIATLPNVNSNIGTFNNITINAKGQATAGTNANYLIDSTSNGVLVRTALNTTTARTITGTTNQITVTNGSGVAANPTIAIANNPVIPGTGSMTLPTGSTAERDTPTNGQLRFNNNSMELEVSRFNKYIPVGKVVQFFVGNIIQTTGTTILPYDATQPTITEGFQIWGQNITPLYNGSTIVVIYSIFTECSSTRRSMATALYFDSNAIAVNVGYTDTVSVPTCLSITKSFQTTDIIPIAITARAGPGQAATMYVNRGNTETMGGLTSTNYIIMEII